MEKLKSIIAQYGRWNELKDYVDRIEAHVDSDFSHAFENAKSLLETIGKEICKIKGVDIAVTATMQSILKKAFIAMGYSSNYLVVQISNSLATIAQNMGELRNEIGPTSHGRSLEELRERNNKIDNLTKNFLIDSTVILSCFLIQTFESKNPRIPVTTQDKIKFSEHEDFNEFWDDSFGEFVMGNYSYQASEILYSVDYPAYETECKVYMNGEEDKNDS